MFASGRIVLAACAALMCASCCSAAAEPNIEAKDGNVVVTGASDVVLQNANQTAMWRLSGAVEQAEIVGTLSDAIDALQLSVDDTVSHDSFDSLSTAVGAELANNGMSIAALSTNVADTADLLADVSTSLVDVDAEAGQRLTALENALQSASDSIETNTDNTATLTTNVGNVEDEVETLSTAVQQAHVRLDTLSNAVNTANDNIATANDKHNALSSALSSSLSSMASTQVKLSQQLSSLEVATSDIKSRVIPPSSCNEIKKASPGAQTGLYLIQPSDSHVPIYVHCRMEGARGWTLVGMVHTANGGGVSEPESWFASGYFKDSELLRSNTNQVNHPPCALGATPFLPYITSQPSSRTIIRLELLAEDDISVTRNAYKYVTPANYPMLFRVGSQMSTPLCYNPEMTVLCTNGIIGTSGGSTQIFGFYVKAQDGGVGGNLGGVVHLRQDSDASGGSYSGVCSATNDNPNWPDDAIDGHWGNGLRVWLL